jgi:hypothetical protein
MLAPKRISEKKHRLPLECYQGKVQIAFTLCFNQKSAIFQDKKTYNAFLKLLKQATE